MSKNQTPTISLTEHIGNIVFEKKDEAISFSETPTLEEDLLYRHQKVLDIKVQSVALPPNYNPAPKTEAEVMDWLRNTVNNNYSFAYSIALKYGERLKLKLEQKEPYINK